MMMGTILVIDDEQVILSAFEEMLGNLGYTVVTASNFPLAMEALEIHQPDMVVTDLNMPGGNGLEIYRRIHAANPKLPVIIMTGRGTMETAIEATKLGVFDYQLKPFDPNAMIAAIERAMECVRLMRTNVLLNPDVVSSDDAMIGDSPSMQTVFMSIGRVAGTDATVLIRGESGTGKELVARAIYQHGARANQPLLVVNCAAIPEALLESELFGHERGAFTGAQSQRIGKFQQAHQGTIFLDEIGEISMTVQAKLLRLLQQKSFERIGSNETVSADVRILAATNRNLEQAISDGSFREDLYHRLNVVTIQIPPLRDRPKDLEKLVSYFLQRYSRDLKIDSPILTDDALAAINDYSWPGNVRELEHCIYRSLIFSAGYPIQAEDILRARDSADSRSHESVPVEPALVNLIHQYLDRYASKGVYERLTSDVERLLLAEALKRCSGNQTQAAQLLGLARPTLHSKLQRYRLTDQ